MDENSQIACITIICLFLICLVCLLFALFRQSKISNHRLEEVLID